MPSAAIALTAYFILLMLSWATHRNEVSWDYVLVLQNVASILLLLWFTMVLVDSTERLHRVLLVAVSSGALASVYVIRDWIGNRGMAGYRPGGVAGDANYFALCATVAALLAFGLLQGHRPRWEKFYLQGCFAVIIIAFSLAASRGGVVGLAAGLLLLTVRSRARWRKIAIIGLLIVPPLMMGSGSVIQRFVNPGFGDTAAVEARRIVWNAALRMIAANPVTGVGLARFRDLIVQYEEPYASVQVRSMAHNTYLEVAAEQGLSGFLVFGLALAMVWIGLQRAIRDSRRIGPPLLYECAIGLQAALLAAMVCAFFVSAGWQRFFWFIPFLAAAAVRLGRGETVAALLALKEGSSDAAPAGAPTYDLIEATRPQTP
jgi:O-antigen ligase